MLKLPKVGQGTAFDLYNNNFSKKEISAVISEGISRGVNLIDTAENYGKGEIEKIIGNVIKKNRDQVTLATKFSPENSEYKKVIKSCDGSLKRLKTDYIDIFQIHWPNPNVPIEETLRALVFLKEKGKIKEFGSGNFPLKLLKKSKMVLGEKNFFSLQSEFNLFEKTIEEDGVYNFCINNNIKIIAFSPLDQGRLTSINEGQQSVLESIAKHHKKTLAQVILAWIISKKITPIPMTLSLKHLRENSEAARIVLSKKEIEKINKHFYQKFKYIPTSEINVLRNGERNSKAYSTLGEAKDNKLGFVPSPKELAKEFKEFGFLKPVRLIKNSSDSRYKYDLISGRIRYWGWIIAYGTNKPIPAYVRENLIMS